MTHQFLAGSGRQGDVFIVPDGLSLRGTFACNAYWHMPCKAKRIAARIEVFEQEERAIKHRRLTRAFPRQHEEEEANATDKTNDIPLL